MLKLFNNVASARLQEVITRKIFKQTGRYYELILDENQIFSRKSFLLTIIKDKENQENRFRRINVRKITSLEEIAKLNYNSVHIEIDGKILKNLDFLAMNCSSLRKGCRSKKDLVLHFFKR